MNAIIQLERMGYSFQLAIDYSGPDDPPTGAESLLAELAANKDEAIHWLAAREDVFASGPLPDKEGTVALPAQGECVSVPPAEGLWTVVPPSEGDAYEITFDGNDEGQRKRWGLAAQAGLIHVTDKVKVHRHSGKCVVSFRCALPLEWLEQDITAEAKQQYDAVLERIHRGEAWLKANADDPQCDGFYTAFLSLFDDLKALYHAIDEPLADPFAGYHHQSIIK
jgi:hypothetical protein